MAGRGEKGQVAFATLIASESSTLIEATRNSDSIILRLTL